ncbi:ATP-grasp domain-containing protein [Pontimonas sp.]|nr:biotin carboxylase N-terminal domain-containing protein [Pontimonas sp.]MDA8863254.1 ATP-grasp domain-containing protein [Pontimonas sp.]
MEAISKLLIANRGEIAVRVIRAAKDAGINTVAIYADQDRNARFVRLAHEAYALNGKTSQETYLVPEKILSIAKRSGANAIHPGYGFLSENADFAQMVIDAGLIWIGPPPAAIRSLGDKVSARHIAQKVGAPLAPGTPDPVTSADEVVAFAREYGVPVAIKAAHGGGGRGLKVAYTLEEIPEQFDSATREALSAFGRGECFVEKYLERPRHVETQCLADANGNVVVVSTRDCSLQRRHQKLVEEAPAPFLTEAQERILYESSKALLKEAGYVGAGTCEFLIGKDGTISFLEVNTRLQVEHPVSEEITGIDLVREQFRIAEGGVIEYDDPLIHGHSIEFRINGEDAGRGFLPTPGPVHSVRFPGGPGVRVDSGITTGDIITGSFDSLLAKLIVTGATRKDALEKARRALKEFEITGLPTVIPFHRAIVEEPAFIADAASDFLVHTRWIETELETVIEPWDGAIEEGFDVEELYRTVVVEVEGRRLKVGVPAGIFAAGQRATLGKAPKRAVTGSSAAGASEGRIMSPMQATVVKVLVEPGTTVVAGDLVCVLEAMKMEQPIMAPIDGTVETVGVSPGDSISGGHLLAVIA